MTVVVSDTNVFVALFKCELLLKVFSNTRVSLKIPNKIYEELTLPTHRVKREYPALSAQVINWVHNKNHNDTISLVVLNIQKDLVSPSALNVHYLLEEDASLDPGEREAIPLTIELSAVFVSCDSDAIKEYEDIQDKNGSTAFLFIEYCRNLLDQYMISQKDFDSIEAAIKG